MKISNTGFKNLFLIHPKVLVDERGYFFESFNERMFEEKSGLNIRFVQDNEASSKFGVLRGLHFQAPPYSQSKLVRVVEGTVLDVAVDLREESETFGKYYSVELSSSNKTQLFIPRGFAHGYVVLSDKAIFQYKCDNFYKPEAEGGIFWADPNLKIDWKIEEKHILISEKDKKYPTLMAGKSCFKKNIQLYPDNWE